MPNDKVTKTDKDRYRTCCAVCHIKCGTVFLGALEAVVCLIVLITVIQQIMWKNEHSSTCSRNLFRDCLIFQFNHFNVTLVFDYIVVLMMCCILFSILLLMCGIMSDTSCLLLPHLAVQGLFLLFSIGYFILYAWSYFYGDLYTHSRQFKVQSLVERMWLASLLLLLACFQSYLFSAVVRCSMYLSGIEENRRQRASAFERCSERVRIAKENGLWRTTSWGGGFQQYKGQYDDSKEKRENNKQKGFHVKWNFMENVVVQDEETPIISPPSSSSPERIVTVERDLPEKHSPPRLEHKTRPVGEGRRRSSQNTIEDEIRFVQREGRIHDSRRVQSESPKKERNIKHSELKNTPSEGHNPQWHGKPQTSTNTELIVDLEREPKVAHSQKKKTFEMEAVRHNSIHVEKLHTEHHHHHQNENYPSTSTDKVHSSVKVKRVLSNSKSSSRPPLRTYKSVDSDECGITKKSVSPQREVRAGKRFSIEGEDPVVTHYIRSHRSPEKRDSLPVVKKVSITSTSHVY